MYRYFTEKEFNACTPSCSIIDMDGDFMEMLDKLRDIAGIPIVINCAYRSREWDLKKGRSGNSAHTKGKAVDIRCIDSSNRYKIIYAAIQLGFRRIGIADTFIHLDMDESLPQGVIWLY